MLFRARWILPVSSAPIADGALLVRDGQIADLGPAAEVLGRHRDERVQDLGDTALLPGLINVHSHLELGLLRGLLVDLPFFPWIRAVVKIQREAFLPGDHDLASLVGAAEMLRAGITCVADCSASGAPLDALLDSGLRGIVHQEVFAPAPSWLAEAVPTLERRPDALSARAASSGGRVRVGVSPHSPYMACPALLDIAARIACDRSLPLSIHLAESADEDAFVRNGTGPIAEHFRERGFPVSGRGRSPVEHVAAHGYLALPVQAQLVHLARASSADLDLVAHGVRGGARLGLAACPRSNANLGNGAPDLAGWTRRGIPWGLGTDGASSVASLNLFDEKKGASEKVSDSISGLTEMESDTFFDDPFFSLAAARSLGMEREIGSLEVGKQADLCAIRVKPSSMKAADVAAALGDTASPGDVCLTMVGGRVLWDGSSITSLDEAALAARYTTRATSLTRWVRGAF